MRDNEQRLIAQARQGDTAALSAIYDQYAEKIYIYLYHRLGDRQLAEDLTGDVFVRMVEAADTPRFADTSLSGWLYRIAHNLLVDHFRRQREEVALPEELPMPTTATGSGEGPAAIVERKLAQDGLRKALEVLTEEQRQVIVLRFGEGLTAREVAETMGKQENAIWQLQHRALNGLRRALAGDLA
ncbi:MAG: sigma-70 family RNA polymerase sigma factor [Anaerolineae bacterium]